MKMNLGRLGSHALPLGRAKLSPAVQTPIAPDPVRIGHIQARPHLKMDTVIVRTFRAATGKVDRSMPHHRTRGHGGILNIKALERILTVTHLRAVLSP